MCCGTSNVQLGGRNFKVNYPKLTFMYVIENTVSLYFNNFFLNINFYLMISDHKVISNFLVLLYITSLILYLNQNVKSFTIKTFVFLEEMILKWMEILWG